MLLLTIDRSTVKYLLDHDKNYEILSHAGTHQLDFKLFPRIPSWAPDWRVPSDYKNKITDWVPPSPTSRELVRNNYVCLEDHGVLACAGFKFDTIHSIRKTPEDIKYSDGSIGRVTWNKWQRRNLIEHGIGSDQVTVSSLFARSHPLTYRRKLASTKGGTLCLAPHDTQPGDSIRRFIGSLIPYILRPLQENEWMRKDGGSWSRLMNKISAWVFWVKELDSTAGEMDEEILSALKEKAGNGDAKLEHCSFVGECLVDGLMNRSMDNRSAEKYDTTIVAFALH